MSIIFDKIARTMFKQQKGMVEFNKLLTLSVASYPAVISALYRYISLTQRSSIMMLLLKVKLQPELFGGLKHIKLVNVSQDQVETILGFLATIRGLDSVKVHTEAGFQLTEKTMKMLVTLIDHLPLLHNLDILIGTVTYTWTKTNCTLCYVHGKLTLVLVTIEQWGSSIVKALVDHKPKFLDDLYTITLTDDVDPAKAVPYFYPLLKLVPRLMHLSLRGSFAAEADYAKLLKHVPKNLTRILLPDMPRSLSSSILQKSAQHLATLTEIRVHHLKHLPPFLPNLWKLEFCPHGILQLDEDTGALEFLTDFKKKYVNHFPKLNTIEIISQPYNVFTDVDYTDAVKEMPYHIEVFKGNLNLGQMISISETLYGRNGLNRFVDAKGNRFKDMQEAIMSPVMVIL